MKNSLNKLACRPWRTYYDQTEDVFKKVRRVKSRIDEHIYKALMHDDEAKDEC